VSDPLGTGPPAPGATPAPVVAVGGVAVVDGAVLLVRRGTEPQVGRWSIPGGRVEAGESLGAAVEREVREETGVAVGCGPFLGWAERIGDGHHFVILDFAATVTSRRPSAGDDAAEAMWVPLADVPGVDLVEGLEAFLRRHRVLEANGVP